jgi:hypothetical protein
MTEFVKVRFHKIRFICKDFKKHFLEKFSEFLFNFFDKVFDFHFKASGA